ncbi:MAG: hypothetical protein R3D98_05115 [Candidatus Krumholzibacteriia bacterium]
MGLRTDFYQPLVYSGLWFVDPAVIWSRDRRDVYLANVLRLPIEERRLEGRFDLGANLGQVGEVRVGAYRGLIRVRELLSVASPLIDERRGGWYARFIHDRLDNLDFPTAGSFLEVEARLSRAALGAEEPYNRLEVRGARALGGDRLACVLRGRAVGDLGSAIPFYDQPWLGGLGNLSGLDPAELQDDNLAMGSLTTLWRIGRLSPILGGNAYLGASLEAGGAWPRIGQVQIDGMRLSAAAFLGVETIFGPLYLGWGWADEGQSSAYFQLGRIF